MNKAIKRNTRLEIFLQVMLVMFAVILALTFNSCAVKYSGSIEHKVVTWSDSESVNWRSLDTTRTGVIKNVDHELYFVGDTLVLKPFYN